MNPRKPVFALALSLILPGFGQLYNGEPNRAIWIFLAFTLLCAPFVAFIALYLPSWLMLPVLAAGLALTLGIWIYAMADAWKGAKARQDYVLKSWQVSSLYPLVFLLCGVLVLPMLTLYVRAHQVEPFRIPSHSMEPGVLRGDYIFADKRYNCPGCKGAVERGDIAIFVYPNNRTRYYIKRIIGLPGDRVELSGRELRVNGKSLTLSETREGDRIRVTESSGAKSWQVQWSADAAGAGLDVTVPSGQVFFMGDNRNATQDSRLFGTVPLQDVVGRARQVWFSSGPEGVRWARMGKVLE